MATYFVDSTTGNDGDSGLTMDLAWATLEFAINVGSPVLRGDTIWVRRLQNEIPGSSIVANVANALFKEPVRVIGWPRTIHTITSSDWVNGSTAVVVDDADMSRAAHQGRYITAPDGNIYLITRVVDASNIVIDREYLGPNANNQEAIISADEDYAEAQAIDDSGWTINKATWNADADDLACVDFNGTGLSCLMRLNWWLANIEMKNSNAAQMINLYGGGFFKFAGCLFSKNTNNALFKSNYSVFPIFIRCIFEGGGAGSTSQHCFYITENSYPQLIDCAIYNFHYPFYFTKAGRIILDNVNLGIEIADRGAELAVWRGVRVFGRDVRLGGANGYISFSYELSSLKIDIDNYGKVKGAHKTWNMSGEVTKVAANGAGDSPNQRAGGAENVIEILYNRTGTGVKETRRDSSAIIFDYEFDADTSTKTYRFYVQSMANLTADEIWLELDYVSGADGTRFVKTRVYSDEAVNVRANQSDWTQYIEIPDITPAVASRVRIRGFCGYYHATNKIYIDPGDFLYLPVSLCEGEAGYVSKIRLHGV